MGNWINTVKRNWKVVAAGIPTIWLCAVAFGQAKQTIQSIDDRLSWVEGTHPEATAALSKRNADDNAEIRRRLDQISDDAAASRADIARLCDHFGLPSR